MRSKRIFDIIASFIGLIALSPILLLLSVLIGIHMGFPIFFRQKRTGLYGMQFLLIKFRTMSTNHSGSPVSVKGEKRITPLGAWLRTYKLDEIPELWNVLVGHMSFVGPRPEVPQYSDRLKGEELRILNIRPGLTGPATLKYISEESLLSSVEDPVKYNDEVIWPDKIRINLHYIENRSFWKDIVIICRTFLPNRNLETKQSLHKEVQL